MTKSNRLVKGNPTIAHRKKLFLSAYPKVGTIAKAAEKAGIRRTSAYNWINRDEGFAKKFDQVRLEFSEYLEDLALSLVNKMVANNDYKANPALLITMLNANNPAKYRGTTEVDNTARDFIAGLRKISEENKKSAVKESTETEIIPYEGAKEAIQKKFGSLKNGNADSS